MSKNKKEERINEVIASLKEMSIEEVAEMLGYKNEKVLKSTMNRYGYSWNNNENTFVKKKIEDVTEIYTPLVSTTVGKIINDLNNNNGNLKETLKITNFKNVGDLAAYMKEKNYKWDDSVKNYIQVSAVLNNEEQETDKKLDTAIEGHRNVRQANFEKNIEVIDHVMEGEQILTFIKNNKEQIRRLVFDEESTSNSIPRYCVAGRNITKSIYMIDRVADLISKFSMEKHISQREIAAVAFIEFFKKYGFKHEIDKIFD